MGGPRPLGVWRPALLCAAPTRDRRVTGIDRRPRTGWAGQLCSTPTRLLCPWPGWPQHEAGQGAGSGRGWGWAWACGGQLCPRRSPDGRESCLSGVPQAPPARRHRGLRPLSSQAHPGLAGRTEAVAQPPAGGVEGPQPGRTGRAGCAPRPAPEGSGARAPLSSSGRQERMSRTPTAHRPPPPGTRGRDPALRSHDGALELPPTHDTAPKLSG